MEFPAIESPDEELEGGGVRGGREDDPAARGEEGEEGGSGGFFFRPTERSDLPDEPDLCERSAADTIACSNYA